MKTKPIDKPQKLGSPLPGSSARGSTMMTNYAMIPAMDRMWNLFPRARHPNLMVAVLPVLLIFFATSRSDAQSASSVIYTNLVSYTFSDTFTWHTVGTLTTTFTNGYVFVSGNAGIPSSNTHLYMRVRDQNTNVVSTASLPGADPKSLSVALMDTLTGTAKTYNLDVAASDLTGTPILTNSLDTTFPVSTDLFYLKVLQVQPVTKNVLYTNLVSYAFSDTFTWHTVGTLTTTFTSGRVVVSGNAAIPSSNTHLYMRLRDQNTNVVATASLPGGDPKSLSIVLTDTLSGSTKTYNLDVAASNLQGSPSLTNQLDTTFPVSTDLFYLKILEEN